MRIDFPFALEDLRFHVRNVIGTAVTCRTIVECVCIRVNADERKLAADYSFKHLAEVFILLGVLYVRPDLCSGIPEPHRMNVSSIYECAEIPVFIFAEVYCRV